MSIDQQDISNTPDINQLSSFLVRYGWKHEIVDDTSILTGFAGDNSEFTMFFHVSEEVVFLSIPNYVEIPDKDCIARLYAYLLQINYHSLLAKFSIDELGRPVPILEIPIHFITYESFISGISLLAALADDQYKSVKEASTNPKFQSEFSELNESKKLDE